MKKTISPIEIEKFVRALFPKAPLVERNRIALKTCNVLCEIPDVPVTVLLQKMTVAHIRHTKTYYEEYLTVFSQVESRQLVASTIKEIIIEWSRKY